MLSSAPIVIGALDAVAPAGPPTAVSSRRARRQRSPRYNDPVQEEPRSPERQPADASRGAPGNLAREHATRPLVSGTPVVVGLVVLAVAIVSVLVTLGRDPGMPAKLAEQYTAVMAGSLTADVRTSNPDELSEALARAGVPFTPRVAGLEPALVLTGGRRHEVAGRPAAAWLYETPGKDVALVQAFQARLDELGAPDARRDGDGRELLIFRKITQTLACWQDGSLVYVFSSTLPGETVIGLARRHAAAASGGDE